MASENPFPGQPEDPLEYGHNRWYRSFTSVSEMLAWNDHTPRGTQRKPGGSREKGGGWHGTDDYPEAERLFREGWEFGVQSLAPNIQAIERSIQEQIPVREPYNDVVGSAVDVASYVAGIPESMLNYREEPRPTRSVEIVVNTAVSGGISADTIRARGSVIVALVLALDRLNIPVSIKLRSGNSPSSRQGGWYMTELLLKDEGAPLDLGRATFALAHPAMHRRIVFASREKEASWVVSRFGYHANGSYGQPADVPRELQGDIYFAKSHMADRQWHTPEGATSWVMMKLRELGLLPDNAGSMR